METDVLTQDPTVVQVGGRAVGAEGGGEVRVVRAFREARAGVSEGDAGAITTLELGVRVSAGSKLPVR